MADILFKWSDDYTVGVAEIDEQHKELVRLLNDLHQAIHERHGSDASRKILNELAEYTRVHFAVEESLMRITHYPDFENHKKIHEALIQQVVELQNKLDSGTAKISFELLHFLKQWLMHHIVESDKLFGAFFTHSKASANWMPPPQAGEQQKSRWKFW
ncbi:bacteriohemerythrin [Uliginosibacterium gangwonense]|uniref:bacteriohemerythrin n=1 Tax=Uliginosibacterium gangwonense TaxID=392736 RepID=UPI00037C0EDE|nr:bacteriohemerythrin [Uliginosibacterium gangwonense]